MTFWLWIIILIGALVLEVTSLTALLSIWFAVGAVFALIALQLGINFIGQVLIFFVSSLIFIVVCRPLVKKYTRVNFIPTNADRIIGLQARLISPITEEQWGRIKLQGIEWYAISSDQTEIPEGTLVEIVSIEGSKAIVKPI